MVEDDFRRFRISLLESPPPPSLSSSCSSAKYQVSPQTTLFGFIAAVGTEALNFDLIVLYYKSLTFLSLLHAVTLFGGRENSPEKNRKKCTFARSSQIKENRRGLWVTPDESGDPGGSETEICLSLTS